MIHGIKQFVVVRVHMYIKEHIVNNILSAYI